MRCRALSTKLVIEHPEQACRTQSGSLRQDAPVDPRHSFSNVLDREGVAGAYVTSPTSGGEGGHVREPDVDDDLSRSAGRRPSGRGVFPQAATTPPILADRMPSSDSGSPLAGRLQCDRSGRQRFPTGIGDILVFGSLRAPILTERRASRRSWLASFAARSAAIASRDPAARATPAQQATVFENGTSWQRQSITVRSRYRREDLHASGVVNRQRALRNARTQHARQFIDTARRVRFCSSASIRAARPGFDAVPFFGLCSLTRRATRGRRHRAPVRLPQNAISSLGLRRRSSDHVDIAPHRRSTNHDTPHPDAGLTSQMVVWRSAKRLHAPGPTQATRPTSSPAWSL